MLDNYEDILSIEDICKILHIGKNTAYRMLMAQEIPNKKIRHKYIIPKIGMINYLSTIGKST